MVDMPIIRGEEAFPLGVLNDGKHDRCVAIRLQDFVEYIPEIRVGQRNGVSRQIATVFIAQQAVVKERWIADDQIVLLAVEMLRRISVNHTDSIAPRCRGCICLCLNRRIPIDLDRINVNTLASLRQHERK